MKLSLYISIIILFISQAMFAQSSPKFSGLMFGDYFYNAAAHDASQKDLNGFQFRRIYITTDYTISDNFNTRFRLESDQSNNSLTPGGKLGVMVKDAWLQWKNIFKGSNLIVGISPTPAFDVSEGAWGHRYVEKTILDLFGVVPSRDFGVDLKGNFGDGSIVKYWVKIGNNSGNSPEANKHKRFYGMLQFDPSENIVFTVYGDYASAPQKFDAFDKTSKSNNSFVGAAFFNYKQKGVFSVGVEGFIKSQQNNFAANVNSALASQNGSGISVWGFVNITENAQLVGRFDTYDPNSDLSNDGKGLILAGVQFNPIKNVSVTPNVEVITYQADSKNGGDKNDIVPRLTFSWEF